MYKDIESSAGAAAVSGSRTAKHGKNKVSNVRQCLISHIPGLFIVTV